VFHHALPAQLKLRRNSVRNVMVDRQHARDALVARLSSSLQSYDAPVL